MKFFLEHSPPTMPRSYYKCVQRAMEDQRRRGYGPNKNGDNIFFGTDPHGRSTNSDYVRTFRNPDNRSRKPSNNSSRPNRNSAPNAVRRTSPDSYADAIRIRLLESDNKNLKEEINSLKNNKTENENLKSQLESLNERKLELKNDVNTLEQKLIKSEDNQRRLLEVIDMNPCKFRNGHWTFNIGDRKFIDVREEESRDGTC